MHLSKFWLGLVLLLTLDATAPAQTWWATYANARFGTTADYPADLFAKNDPPPENGHGVSSHTADDCAALTIYGAYNAENDTPASYVERLVDKKGVAYRRVTNTYYAILGVRGADIFYERCNFRQATRRPSIAFRSPIRRAKKSAWDGIVTRISKSLHGNKVFSN